MYLSAQYTHTDWLQACLIKVFVQCIYSWIYKAHIICIYPHNAITLICATDLGSIERGQFVFIRTIHSHRLGTSGTTNWLIDWLGFNAVFNNFSVILWRPVQCIYSWIYRTQTICIYPHNTLTQIGYLRVLLRFSVNVFTLASIERR